nr:hypothetical protein CFP56_08158 [Quercus suber]
MSCTYLSIVFFSAGASPAGFGPLHKQASNFDTLSHSSFPMHDELVALRNERVYMLYHSSEQLIGNSSDLLFQTPATENRTMSAISA